jgi:hypothetical protein
MDNDIDIYWKLNGGRQYSECFKWVNSFSLITQSILCHEMQIPPQKNSNYCPYTDCVFLFSNYGDIDNTDLLYHNCTYDGVKIIIFIFQVRKQAQWA